jgi:hypothetical protein
MLSSALMAVLIIASPAHQSEQPRKVAQVKSACDAQFDRKCVHFVKKTPGEKDTPGVYLITDASKAMPLVTADGSDCVRELTRLDLVR